MSKRLSVGGQAVIEGVMMRSAHGYTVAVRRPDQSISLKEEIINKSNNNLSKLKKLPLIRGIVALVDSMYIGIKCLTYSSNEALGEEEPLNSGAIWLSVVLGIAGAILLFMVLPTLLTGFVRRQLHTSFFLNITEGLIRIAIFLGYVVLIGMMPDIRRVFEYHGAEHKAIHCYEHGCALTVEEARPFTTLHARCGTAFMLLVMFIAILVFSFFGWENVWQRVAIRLLLTPLIAGISYEVIKLADKKMDTSLFWRMVIAPGLWMQRITTKEPDDEQLEVALTALRAALNIEQRYSSTVEDNRRSDND